LKPAPPLAELARVVDLALAEDLGSGDITTDSVAAAGKQLAAVIRSRAAGRIAGVDCIAIAFSKFPQPAAVTIDAADGTDVAPGGTVARIRGSARTVLGAERTILNILARLSGVATATAAAVRLTAGWPVAIKDTRKTTPGMRTLEKYAVAVGGGVNHRMGLHDAVLIKDNHIGLAGSITAAVNGVRSKLGPQMPIQVEVESMDELDEALRCSVAAVLLDNMSPDELRRAVKHVNARCYTEASGGITLDNVPEFAATGVDAISLGWLTHSAAALDLGLDIEPASLRQAIFS